MDYIGNCRIINDVAVTLFCFVGINKNFAADILGKSEELFGILKKADRNGGNYVTNWLSFISGQRLSAYGK